MTQNTRAEFPKGKENKEMSILIGKYFSIFKDLVQTFIKFSEGKGIECVCIVYLGSYEYGWVEMRGPSDNYN